MRGAAEVNVPRPPVLTLSPGPRPFEGGGRRLAVEAEYDGVGFTGLDLTEADARGAHFLDCALRDCLLDATRLGRAGFVDCLAAGAPVDPRGRDDPPRPEAGERPAGVGRPQGDRLRHRQGRPHDLRGVGTDLGGAGPRDVDVRAARPGGLHLAGRR